MIVLSAAESSMSTAARGTHTHVDGSARADVGVRVLTGVLPTTPTRRGEPLTVRSKTGAVTVVPSSLDG